MVNREQFIEKLSRHEECVRAIGKETHGIIDASTREELMVLERNIKELHTRIKENHFEIAIVGLEKAGKSTFANALIGFDILPTKEERCTYTSSCVKYGESTFAEVEFFTAEEFNDRFVSGLKELDVDCANVSYGNFSEQQLNSFLDGKYLSPEQKNIVEDITDMIKSHFEISRWLGQPIKRFSESEMRENEFKNLIQNPDRTDGGYVQKATFAVKAITIYSNQFGDMKNIIVYDVPGFDSPTAIHMEQTKVIKSEHDLQVLANLERHGITTGIDKINSKLSEYNDNVRVGILEKRIRNIETRIRNIVNQIEEMIDEDGFVSMDDNSAEFLAEFAKVQRAFRDSLFDYRPDFRALLVTQPLTQGILNELETNLHPEALFPLPEDIEKQKKTCNPRCRRF